VRTEFAARKSQPPENFGGWQLNERFCYRKTLSRFDNFTRFDTSGTDLQTSVAAAFKLYTDRLQVRVKTSPGLVVRVGNIVPELRPFAANVASHCHK